MNGDKNNNNNKITLVMEVQNRQGYPLYKNVKILKTFTVSQR